MAQINTYTIPARWVIPDNVDQTWQRRSMCRGTVTDRTITDDRMIFPFPNDGAETTRIFRETMCAPCPVRAECLRYALTLGYTGVWGGYELTDTNIREYRKAAKMNALAIAAKPA